MGVTGFALDAGAFLFTNAGLACAGEKFALSGSGNSSVGPFSPGQSRAHMYVFLVILFSVKNCREHYLGMASEIEDFLPGFLDFFKRFRPLFSLP